MRIADCCLVCTYAKDSYHNRANRNVCCSIHQGRITPIYCHCDSFVITESKMRLGRLKSRMKQLGITLGE